VAEDVNALAQEYFEFLLTAWPTWGHLMGNYEQADRFDDVSRAGEEEERRRRLEFAARAESIPPEALSAQNTITRDMLIFDGRRNAEVLDARLEEFGVDPIRVSTAHRLDAGTNLIVGHAIEVVDHQRLPPRDGLPRDHFAS